MSLKHIVRGEVESHNMVGAIRLPCISINPFFFQVFVRLCMYGSVGLFMACSWQGTKDDETDGVAFARGSAVLIHTTLTLSEQ